jgi:hypothetical protein
MTERDSSPVVLNTPESYETARGYVGLLGEIPSSFSAAVRTLLLDHEKNPTTFSSGGKFVVTRLLKSSSIFSSASRAVQQLGIAEDTPTSPEQVVSFITPYQAAGLIGLYYVYRRIKSFASQELWSDIAPTLYTKTLLGGVAGIALPRIGTPFGLMTGILPSITFVLFEKQDPKAFKEYKRHLRLKKLEFDLAYEADTWGCTRLNIGSILIQQLGFGIESAKEFSAGLSVPLGAGSHLTGGEYRFYIAREWIYALEETGASPEITHRGEYYPSALNLSKLLKVTDDIRNDETGELFLFSANAKDQESDGEEIIEAKA